MKEALLISVFLLSSSLHISLQAQNPDLLSNGGWELEKSENEIEVFSKSVDGFKIKAFKASGLVEADIVTVYNVIMDVENYPLWYPDSELGEVLEEKDSLQVRRIVFKLPWPFYRRDLVNGFLTKVEENQIFIEIYAAPEAIEEQRKTVRVNKSEGYWLLTKEDDGTRIIYSAVGDAPGIPSWIVNIFLFDSPITAIQNISEMAKKEKYQFTPDWMKD